MSEREGKSGLDGKEQIVSQEHTSGAKAPHHPVGSVAGDKSPAYLKAAGADAPAYLKAAGADAPAYLAKPQGLPTVIVLRAGVAINPGLPRSNELWCGLHVFE